MALPARLRIRMFVFGPDGLGKPQALFVEFILGVDNSACLLNHIAYPRLRLVPEHLGILVRDVAVVAPSMHAGAISNVNALLVLFCYPLHRVTGTSAELIGAGDGYHDLSRYHRAGAQDESGRYQRQQRPSGARPKQPAPETWLPLFARFAWLWGVVCHRLSLRWYTAKTVDLSQRCRFGVLTQDALECRRVEQLDRASLHLDEPFTLQMREQSADGFELQSQQARNFFARHA
jgi:hypothetical protein